MNAIGFLFTLIAGGMLLGLSRRLAPLPLLLSATYIGIGQQLEIGPLHFTINRLLVTVGFVRVLSKGERIVGGWTLLDRAMLIWAAWAVCSGFFHASGALTLRLGMVYDTFGVYFLFRVFVRDMDDLVTICKMICVLFVPLAAAMMIEKMTGHNSFALLGGDPTGTELRNGHFRARGPFIHQILGGTIGAVCMPLALVLWPRNRKLALAGMAATGAVVVASGSSGPYMTTLAALFALALWKVQGHVRKLRWLAVLSIIALDVVMNDPVYYLLARIDITGGSTGWHRAALIDGAIKHLSGWWLRGTDYTRDWMPTGIPANQANTDITNYYLQMGVWGGLPLMLLFIWVLAVAFGAVGSALRLKENSPVEQRFLIWTLGSILFAHATTFMSIAYFDHQTVVFLYLALAAIGSLCSAAMVERSAVVQESQAGFEALGETFVEHE